MDRVKETDKKKEGGDRKNGRLDEHELQCQIDRMHREEKKIDQMAKDDAERPEAIRELKDKGVESPLDPEVVKQGEENMAEVNRRMEARNAEDKDRSK